MGNGLNVGLREKKDGIKEDEITDLSHWKDGTIIHWDEEEWEKNRFEKEI